MGMIRLIGINMAAIELCVVFISFFCCRNVAFGKHDHPVPTYFGRLHPNGTIVDAKNPANRLHFNFRPKPVSLDSSASLKVSPSLVDNGGTVKVSWSDVTSPSSNDVIVLYCPADAKPDRYLDYILVNTIPTYSKGYGEFEVVLWNVRKECEFRYYRNDNYTSLITKSNLVTFHGGAEVPLQGHLSLTGNPSEMRVMWVSGTEETSLVRYGNDSSMKLFVKGNASKTYSAGDMCASPANGVSFIDPGFIHDVLLTNLKPGTKYCYSYGSDKMMSPVHHFTTAPPVGSAQKFTALVYGDMGISPVPRAYRTADYATQEALNGSADFVFHNGDISYARGYAYIWEQWHALIEPYATILPYMVGVGNHEQDHLHGGSKDPSGAPGDGFHPWWAPGYGVDSGGECGVPMYYRFHMPDNGNAVWWYSFDYGSVHFIMMSTEHNFTEGSRQYKWMEQDLKNINRSLTPWVVIAGHRAMYTSQNLMVDYIVSQGMRHAFESLLYKYKVDLAFWAHYHSYERTCPVYNNHCIRGAPVHIVVGTAGKELDLEDYFSVNWSLYHENNYGFGRLTQVNRSALHWEWVETTSGVVKDQVWLTK